MSTDYINYSVAQRMLQKQGVGAKATAVQNKFVKRWVFWLLFITALALFYVWSRVQVVQLGYEISALQRTNDELSKQVSMLEVEIANLKSPARLENIAKTKLFMQPPASDQIVLIKP